MLPWWVRRHTVLVQRSFRLVEEVGNVLVEWPTDHHPLRICSGHVEPDCGALGVLPGRGSGLQRSQQRSAKSQPYRRV